MVNICVVSYRGTRGIASCPSMVQCCVTLFSGTRTLMYITFNPHAEKQDEKERTEFTPLKKIMLTSKINTAKVVCWDSIHSVSSASLSLCTCQCSFKDSGYKTNRLQKVVAWKTSQFEEILTVDFPANDFFSVSVSFLCSFMLNFESFGL